MRKTQRAKPKNPSDTKESISNKIKEKAQLE